MRYCIVSVLILLFPGGIAAQADLLEQITGISHAFYSRQREDTLLAVNPGDDNVTFICYYHKGKSLLKIFPNPAVDRINIQFSVEHGQSIRIDLFDITGRMIANLISHYIPKGEFTHSVNITDLGLNPGIYFVRLKVYSEFFTRKILVN